MGAMDHWFHPMTRRRREDELAVPGVIRGRKAYLAAEADVTVGDILVDGQNGAQEYAVTRVTEAIGHSGVDHLEAAVRKLSS